MGALSERRKELRLEREKEVEVYVVGGIGEREGSRPIEIVLYYS